MLDQSHFNRRARNLHLPIEELRRFWIIQGRCYLHSNYLLDTKPIPVLGYKPREVWSDFAGSANYGYCASRKLDYFGNTLVTISILDDILVVYNVVPANLNERLAVESVIDHFSCCNIFIEGVFHVIQGAVPDFVV